MLAVGSELVVVGGWKAFDRTYNDVWLLRKRAAPPVEWREDDYVLAVWAVGAIIACLLFFIPQVPEGYWMIPAPFVPLVAWRFAQKAIGTGAAQVAATAVDSKGESKKSK